MMLANCLPRMAVACILGICGTLFLVASDGLGDLILPVIALEVILKADDILFSVISPIIAKHLLEHTLSFELRRHVHRSFHD